MNAAQSSDKRNDKPQEEKDDKVKAVLRWRTSIGTMEARDGDTDYI